MFSRLFSSCFNVKKAKRELLEKIEAILEYFNGYHYSVLPMNEDDIYPEAVGLPKRNEDPEVFLQNLDDMKTKALRRTFEDLSRQVNNAPFISFDEYSKLTGQYLAAEKEYHEWLQASGNNTAPRLGQSNS